MEVQDMEGAERPDPKEEHATTFRIDMPNPVLFNVVSMYNTMGSDIANDTFVALLKNLPEPDQRWIVVFEPFGSY
jgi:hypothetical protein